MNSWGRCMKVELWRLNKCFLLCLAIVWSGVLGCSPRTIGSGVSTRSSGLGRNSAVVNPLVSRVGQNERLIEVNSLEIAPPTVHSSLKGRALSQEEVQAIIMRAAREIMTLKVIPSGAGSKGTTDSILRTEITQYQDRDGSAFGGEPATVSFKMEIVDRARLAPIWVFLLH